MDQPTRLPDVVNLQFTELLQQLIVPAPDGIGRSRYKLSLRDLAEMFLSRGFSFSCEVVRQWETRFAPFLTEKLRARRQGKTGHSWYVDET